MFNQKEMSLLQDLKKSEQLCIEKYTQYADKACSTELKNLFNEIKSKEQQDFRFHQERAWSPISYFG